MKLIFLPVAACVLTLLLTPLAIRLARPIGAVDVPRDARRMHTRPIPRSGGLAIYVAFLLTAAYGVSWNGRALLFFCGVMLIVLPGLLDDVLALSAGAKLIAQTAAAVTVLLARPASVGVLRGWSFPLAVLWLLLCINAHNMIDGLDGLCAGVTAVEGTAVAVLLFLQGNGEGAGVAGVAVGCCAGFLFFNFHPAQVFMGDAGSQLLGLVMGALTLAIDRPAAGSLGWLCPLLIIAIPLSDLIFAVLRRLLRGQSPFAADRGHWHHRLSDAGLSQRTVCGVMMLCAALSGMVAVLVCREAWYGYAAFAVLWAAWVLMLLYSLLHNRAGQVASGEKNASSKK